MNKNDLIAAVSDKSDLSKADATKAVEAVFDVISGELKSGGDVRLVGFGTFSVAQRAASMGCHDPRRSHTHIQHEERRRRPPGKNRVLR